MNAVTVITHRLVDLLIRVFRIEQDSGGTVKISHVSAQDVGVQSVLIHDAGVGVALGTTFHG